MSRTSKTWRMPSERLKYGNKITIIDGKKFHSKKEAMRYQDLKLREKVGEIINLQRQVKHDFIINGIKVCSYVSDFEYIELLPGTFVRTVEDCKGYRTKEYIIKKNLMKALHGIEIRET